MVQCVESLHGEENSLSFFQYCRDRSCGKEVITKDFSFLGELLQVVGVGEKDCANGPSFIKSYQ